MDEAFDQAAAEAALNAPMAAFPECVRFRAAAHTRHPRLAEIRFTADAVEIALAARFPPWTSQGALLARAVQTRPLFAILKALRPDLRGGCDLWLADVPDRAGLAYSGAHTSSLLIPDAQFLSSNAYAEFRAALAGVYRPWVEREDRAFWRGIFNGDPNRQLPNWRSAQRARLCLQYGSVEWQDVFDVGLTGTPVGLIDRERVEIAEAGLMRPPVPLTRFADFRMTLDMDGNSSAWSGLVTKLLMGGVVLKADSPAGARQWFYPRLIPWVHFIPVRSTCPTHPVRLSGCDTTPLPLKPLPVRAKLLHKA